MKRRLLVQIPPPPLVWTCQKKKKKRSRDSKIDEMMIGAVLVCDFH
jgi:hypothetical protein